MPDQPGEERDGVALTNLDQPLFPDAAATKRDLLDYLDGISGPLIEAVRDRPLSVIRVLRGQKPFMQKNTPTYAPPWIKTAEFWAESAGRTVAYPLCDDRRTLFWLGNQRAIEFHPALIKITSPRDQTDMILDLDPPDDAGAGTFRLAVAAARLVRTALDEAGLAGAVKTSGSKGVHIFVPLEAGQDLADIAAATRAVASRAERIDPELATTAFIREDRGGRVFLDSTRSGGATVAAAYSPRIRPGVPVSFPVGWDELDHVRPGDFTIHSAPALLAGQNRWADSMPAPQTLPADLVAEGHAIPVARVQAMHEGKRRARARRDVSPG